MDQPSVSTTAAKSHGESLYDLPQGRFLRDLIMGFRNTQLIAVAARLKLADHLKQGPKTAERLSILTQTESGSLYRLLRTLASVGIFKENEDSTFSITSTAELLCEEKSGSLRPLAILYGEEWLSRAYSNLGYSVETGKPAFDYIHGKSLYEYLEQDRLAADKFNCAMSAYSAAEAEAIELAYDFSGAKIVVDVGGGHGALLTSLLKANHYLTGIVFDLPKVIDSVNANSILSTKELNISYVGGNFFKEVPEGGDIYIMKSVLHNWDDDQCRSILTNCRKAMRDNSTLLVVERVIPSRNEQSEATLFDINMLVVTGGRERSKQEYDKLFDAAGFSLNRVIPTRSSVSIIEGMPKNGKKGSGF
jgi:hypothetical protein